MAILLHNLLARAPKLQDANAVTTLLRACDAAENAVSYYTEEDLLTGWRRPGFNLATDAWVIVTTKGQLVGYASVSDSEHVHIDMKVCVHPHYRNRGIGTFLLRLAEVRARQHVRHAPSGARVTLSSTVSDTNQTAKNLLEHEGYSLVKHFWRIVIETDEDPDALQSVDVSERQNKVRAALDVDHPCATGITRIYEPSGLYIVRQYAVYEKELRAGEQLLQGEVLGTRLVVASTKDAAA